MSTSSGADTTVCIVGGGPAGMMLGFLLARLGVAVTVLEKHDDFLRDFRGDTIHPSTLEVMGELGLLEDLLARPHDEVREITVAIGDERIGLADFAHLPTRCRFLAFMPQWDFLDFLAEQARALPSFTLRMGVEGIGLLEEGGRMRGVTVRTPEGTASIRAGLVVGADGRDSTVRSEAGLDVETFGVPIDVLWMRISKGPADGSAVLGHIVGGRMMVTLDRGDYWQCAYVIRKGAFDEIRRRGLDVFRAEIGRVAPQLRHCVHEIDDWDRVKLLTVRVDRLRSWHRPGLLCIGDAAHAMSPIGGVGINLAIQDAVATANILGPHLRAGEPVDGHLDRVRRRRTLPTLLTQKAQLAIQDRVIGKVLAGGTGRPPALVRLLDRWKPLRRIPARLIGLGVLPEHVRVVDRA